jgi:predicted dehydrogenase
MADILRWAILGTGNIASKFAQGLEALPDARLVAVGSRTQQSADRFGDQFKAANRYASYAGAAHDPEVDAVYIATPHTLHLDNMLLCLEAGKAVLCEKPFTINAKQAQVAIDLARDRGLFLMEAMWTRFLPLMVEVRHLIAGGAIGEIRMVTADFGFRSKFNPLSRVFDPELGGGALLDVGIYPLSLASMLMGEPQSIFSHVNLGESGVDEQESIILHYAGGGMAALQASISTVTPNEATIMGTEGWIRIHRRWWYPDTYTLHGTGQEPETHKVPIEGNGYNYEADEVHAALRAGKTESDIMPLDETLAIMHTMDSLRKQWGLRYPME